MPATATIRAMLTSLTQGKRLVMNGGPTQEAMMIDNCGIDICDC